MSRNGELDSLKAKEQEAFRQKQAAYQRYEEAKKTYKFCIYKYAIRMERSLFGSWSNELWIWGDVGIKLELSWGLGWVFKDSWW